MSKNTQKSVGVFHRGLSFKKDGWKLSRRVGKKVIKSSKVSTPTVKKKKKELHLVRCSSYMATVQSQDL